MHGGHCGGRSRHLRPDFFDLHARRYRSRLGNVCADADQFCRASRCRICHQEQLYIGVPKQHHDSNERRHGGFDVLHVGLVHCSDSDLYRRRLYHRQRVPESCCCRHAVRYHGNSGELSVFADVARCGLFMGINDEPFCSCYHSGSIG